MSAARRAIDVDAFEALMLDQFRTEPFHNLRFIYGPSLAPDVRAEPASTRRAALSTQARRQAFDVFWHAGVIRVQEVRGFTGWRAFTSMVARSSPTWATAGLR